MKAMKETHDAKFDQVNTKFDQINSRLALVEKLLYIVLAAIIGGLVKIVFFP
jgi:hypothetical protein